MWVGGWVVVQSRLAAPSSYALSFGIAPSLYTTLERQGSPVLFSHPRRVSQCNLVDYPRSDAVDGADRARDTTSSTSSDGLSAIVHEPDTHQETRIENQDHRLRLQLWTVFRLNLRL